MNNTHEAWREEDGREWASEVYVGVRELSALDGTGEAARAFAERLDDERALIDNSEVICVSEIGSEYVERYSVRAEVSVDYYADRMVGP